MGCRCRAHLRERQINVKTIEANRDRHVSLVSDFVNARQAHGLLRLCIFHEPMPHAAMAQVFRTEQDDASIETQCVRRYPASERVESIGESVLPPDRASKLLLHN